jgi:hypothetical protein
LISGLFEFGECGSFSIDLNDTDVNSFGGKLHVLSKSESSNDRSLRFTRFSSTNKSYLWIEMDYKRSNALKTALRIKFVIKHSNYMKSMLFGN